MTINLLARGLLLFLFAGGHAFAMSTDEAIRHSRELAVQQRYDEALALLKKAQSQDPNNLELTLATIRLLIWQGNTAAAQQRLDALDHRYHNQGDVMLLQAGLAYIQQDYPTAIALYERILAQHPHDEDAQSGLARAQRAQSAPSESTFYRWQLDAGYEHSSFSRLNQPNWNQGFLQLTHFMNEKKTALHAKTTRYDQFATIDTEYELGVDHAFAEYLNGYGYGAITPSADFRPDYRVAGGGAARIRNYHDGFIPVWLTIDSRHDDYDAVNILTINPGLRVEPMPGWNVAMRKISVDADNASRVYGEDYRIDGTLFAWLRIYAGYADAPETEAAVTITTRSYFGGLALDMTPASTLRVGYTHDDRENAYIRRVIHASLSYQF